MLDSDGCLTDDHWYKVNCPLSTVNSSSVSDLNSENIKLPHSTLPNVEQEMTDDDLVISDEDFLSAITFLTPNSSRGPD